MGREHTFLPGGTLQHRPAKQVLVHHIQFPGAAGLVQHQQVRFLRHGNGQVPVLQGPRGGLFGVVHLKDEFLPGLAPVDRGPQLLQQRDLPALATLQELHDDHLFSAAQCTQRKAHGGGGLALAVAVIQMQQSHLFHTVLLIRSVPFYPITPGGRTQRFRKNFLLTDTDFL